MSEPDLQFIIEDDVPPQEVEVYSVESARVITRIISMMCAGVTEVTTRAGHQFVQTYSLAKGLKEFGSRGKEAAMKEMRQLHERMVFQPIMISELSPIERTRAMESLIFLAEKRDGSIKGRTCANGSNQRSFIQRDEAASPTAITESILLTALIDANEHRDVMTADIPNAFVQTKIDPKEKTERITMRIRGVMVDMLLEIDKERYAPYIIEEKGKQKTLYVIMLKALYGMLQSALWFYKRFRKDIEQIGFVINPYDPCVANRLVNGKQHTITWHVDDVKSSHQDPSVNDEFFHWLNAMYASDGIGEVKAVRGKKHDYLGIILNFEQPGTLVLDMSTYIDRMISEYPAQLTGVSKCPWTDSLYRVDQSLPLLQENKAEAFHTFVMKGMFIAKRARQDILPAITFLATRVTEPNEGDWRKLTKVMNFLKATMHHVTTLRMSNDNQILWFVDAAFAVHRDMKSHTGAVMSMGQGVVCSISSKQKVNSRSSTEAEFIAVDDVLSKVLWTKLFLESQGLQITHNIIYRDNKSAMKMELNGKYSSGKRTRHFNIKYYYITDLIERKELTVEFCPTDRMLADYMTKPLVGAKFIKMWTQILGKDPIFGQQECVGE